MNTSCIFQRRIIPSTRLSVAARLLFLIASATLVGQTVDSVLTGTVTDPSGAALVNTRVTAQNKNTAVEYSAIANSAGQYRMVHLPVGVYDVTAMAPNFVESRVESVDLQLSRTANVNFSLTLPTQTTTVVVEQSLAPIDAASAQLQVNFSTRAVADIPTSSTGSGIYNLSLLGAGIASPGGLGIGVGPSIAGQRPTGNRYYVEGSDNNSYFSPGPLGVISNEAVGEVTLLQNHFSAEFGGATGGIFSAALKSGGNQVHGALYEYMQNRNLNSLDAQYSRQGIQSNPRFDSNRFGAYLGGPVIKNKVFYFANFEYNPVGNAQSPSNVVYAPTQAGYQALHALSGISSANLQALEKYVAPATAASSSVTVLGTPIPIGPLSILGRSYSNSSHGAGSLDWNISGRDQMRGRYVYSGLQGTDPNSSSTLPVFYATLPANAHFVSLSEYHSFSPTLQNEFRAAYSHSNTRRNAPDGLSFPGLDSFPTLTFQDLGSLQLGPAATVPNGQLQGTLQLTDNVTKTFGRHTLKAGYDFRDIILTGYTVSNPRGSYFYRTLDRYLQDLSPNGTTTSSRTLGTGGPLVGGLPLGFLQNAAYLEDSFRVRPNLTIDLGIRYEYVTVPVASRAQAFSSMADVPGVLTFRAPSSSKNDWSPRVGFAYSPGGSNVWVIRGGFGRTFDMPFSNIAANTLPAYYGSTVTISANAQIPNFLQNGGALAPALPTDPAKARAGITGYNPDQNRPYALNYTLGVQRILGRDYTVEARYIGSRGVHLLVQDQLSRYGSVTPTQNIPTFIAPPTTAQLAGLTTSLLDLYTIAGGTIDPFGTSYGFTKLITSYEPRGNSQYHGFALQVTKRYSKNFSLLGAYTWSHAMDDSTATVASTILTPRRPQDFQNMRAEWASSMLDRRHRLTITPIVDITPFSRRSWALKNLVGNWNLAATYTYESPEYATVQSNVDSNINGDATPDRAIVNPAGAWNVGSDVTGVDRNGNPATSADSLVAYVANNPKARYIVAGQGAYATGGRNTFPLDPINNIDASIRKVFQIGESKRLELGAQFFNLLNHSQFTPGFINDVYVSKSVNRNFLIPSHAQFGQYQQFFPSNARWTQIVGRFTF